MIILFVCVCMFKVYRALVFLIADPLYKAPFDVEFIYLFRRVGTRRRYPLFCPVLSVFWLLFFFFFFDLFSWSIEVFYFAQIIHKFCEGGEDIQAYWHFYVWHSLCLSGGWWWCWWGKENQTPRLFQWTALILNLTHLHLLTYLHCSLIPTVKFVVWIGDATHARLLFLPVIAEVTGWWWIGNVWSHTRTQPIMFTLCTHII